MKKVIGIYNANGGFVGELEYIVGKVLKARHCSLCDITHGLSIKGKDEWIELVKSFPIPVETRHLNELDEDIYNLVKDNAPCIVYVDDNESKIILDENELDSCNKDPKILFSLLRTKLNL